MFKQYIQNTAADTSTLLYAFFFVMHFRDMDGEWFEGTELYKIWEEAPDLTDIQLVDKLLTCETGLRQFEIKHLGKPSVDRSAVAASESSDPKG